MSVQVRRRREAASFLSTYVGAQGELLVDTTNNRIQVHDGATPGGWPAAGIGDMTGRNALINGSFAINQRGYASGVALAAGAYAHDRWKAGASGCSYTFSQALPDTTITITAGTLVQAVEAANVYATTWWLTWTGSAQARVWQGAASGAFSSGTAMNVGGVAVNALQVTGLVIGTIAGVEFSTGTLGFVQLERALPNAGPTRFERRQGELALCRNYFRFAEPGIGAWFVGGSSAQAQLQFNYADMRPSTIPTLSLAVSTITIADPGVANVAFSSASMGPNAVGTTSATMNFAAGSGSQTGSPTASHIALLVTSACVAVSKEL